jgi:hypothetical protein
MSVEERSVLFVTGRPEKTRKNTEAWLVNHGIEANFQASLFMRPDGDRRPDPIIKQDILARIRDAQFEPVLVFDDRQSVVDMWREQGIRVAQVAPGNF